MIEYFIELDYTSLRQTIWLGCIMALLLPLATVYFIQKQYTYLSDYDHPFVKVEINEKSCITITFIDFRHMHRFFTAMRRKDICDESDDLPLFLV